MLAKRTINPKQTTYLEESGILNKHSLLNLELYERFLKPSKHSLYLSSVPNPFYFTGALAMKEFFL